MTENRTDCAKTIETERLLLRPFSLKDAEALFDIIGDKITNRFLPMFPPKDVGEAEEILRERYLPDAARPNRAVYAVTLKSDETLVGYVTVSDGESRDLGYAVKREYWHRGIAAEAASAVSEAMKRSGVPYLTATHDVNNPRSGNVMRTIGMTYRYSYEELVEPKNELVVFRMYQINFDGSDDVYRGYWDISEKRFIEHLEKAD